MKLEHEYTNFQIPIEEIENRLGKKYAESYVTWERFKSIDLDEKDHIQLRINRSFMLRSRPSKH